MLYTYFQIGKTMTKKLPRFILIVASLCVANNLYASRGYYTYEELRSLGCIGKKNCSFKVITGEDRGGLNCRASASFNSRVLKIVPKGNKVRWKRWEQDKKGRQFFRVRHGSTTCYLYATRDRIAPFNAKSSKKGITPKKRKHSTKRGFRFKRACEAGTQYTIATVGDILLHGALQKQAAMRKDFKRLWKPFLSYFQRADIAYANLEGPAAKGINKYGKSVKDPGHTFDRQIYSSFPQFNYHPNLISDLVKSGFDVVSTANNHSLDRRTLGVNRTIDALKKYGLRFTGTRKKGKNSPWHTIVKRKGLRISWIACTYGTNGIPDTYHQVLHCFKSRDQRTILKLIKKQSKNPNIDAVFVTPHWGSEYKNRPNSQQVALGKKFLEAGALAVIGSHPHVLQPMQKYITRNGRETFIIYSMGNFVSNQKEVRRRATVVLFVGLTKNKRGTFLNGVKFIPAIMNNYSAANHYQLAPSKPQDAINQESYKHILSVLSEKHQVAYGDSVVTNEHCQQVK
jgi:poly-gamma-glutamate synthesis protein (capsule biosynthesis protein)